MIKNIVISMCCMAFSGSLWAQVPVGKVLKGENLAVVSLEEAVSKAKPGTVVVLGEQHGTTPMAEAQVEILRLARSAGLRVSVGMEFFEYPFQALVNAWREGSLSEYDFLNGIAWKGFPFNFYREQVLFPAKEDFVIALNSPKNVTSTISKLGMDALTDQQKAMLPPNFTRGNERYFERFRNAMGDHLPSPDALERYFLAQSVWDDTMAWKASEFIKAHPEQTLFVVVGEFHAQYGGGLPDRLRARGIEDVVVFSMVNFNGLTNEERESEVNPQTVNGQRADFIWTFDF